MSRNPVTLGSWTAMAAAALFGITLPVVAHFGRHTGPFATATLLYAGAAVGAGLPRRRWDEAPITRAHAVRLAVVALFGAVLAPAALAWGLQRSGALAGSLLLNLEALLTVLLAALAYREPVGRRVTTACLLMLLGGAFLAFRSRGGGDGSLLGVMAVALATLSWAIDNTLTRPLADFDPRAVVFWKAALGAGLSSLVALRVDEGWPTLLDAVALVGCGASGYGLSLRFYLRAQRSLGAARTGSLFALAPFLGAAASLLTGDRSHPALVGLSSIFFGAAAYLHVTEQHRHLHRHEALEHDHAHRHDDGHHDHDHDPPFVGTHTHPHRHEAIEHDHPHGSDLHHRHRHG